MWHLVFTCWLDNVHIQCSKDTVTYIDSIPLEDHVFVHLGQNHRCFTSQCKIYTLLYSQQKVTFSFISCRWRRNTYSVAWEPTPVDCRYLALKHVSYSRFEIVVDLHYNSMDELPQRSGVAFTLRPWLINQWVVNPFSWIRKCVTDWNEISMSSLLFSFTVLSLSFALCLIFCLLIVVWDTIHECLSASYRVTKPVVTQTPPQTHISHFGMMALPVLAFLIILIKTILLLMM